MIVSGLPRVVMGLVPGSEPPAQREVTGLLLTCTGIPEHSRA